MGFVTGREPGPRTHPLMRQVWEARRRKDIGRQELAARVGMSINTLRAWELGLASPRLEGVEALFRALGMRLRWTVDRRVSRGTDSISQLR